jgi:membrane-bound inhibitor of C-type lysozyme
MRHLIAAFVVVAALGACQTPAQKSPPLGSARNVRVTVAYNCDDGLAFTAAFLVSPEAVELHFANGDQLLLPQVVSGSGFRYQDARHEFQGKADDALYTLGKATPVKCYVSK